MFPLLVLTSILFSQSGCHVPNNPESSKLNAYMPPTFQDRQASSADFNNEWDTSDVDISYVDKTRRLIAFTFDDTPSKTLEGILTVFTSYNERNPDCKATATLFINGGLVNESSLHFLHLAHIAGFEFGNHTHTHQDLTALAQERIQEEIDKTEHILQSIDGKTRHLIRAPFGKINQEIKNLVKAPIIDWSIDTLDWTNVDAEDIEEQILREKFPGAIVLMHDGYLGTIDALKTLLPALKEEGYQVVSVSAMAKAHGCVLKNGNTYIRARKKRISGTS